MEIETQENFNLNLMHYYYHYCVSNNKSGIVSTSKDFNKTMHSITHTNQNGQKVSPSSIKSFQNFIQKISHTSKNQKNKVNEKILTNGTHEEIEGVDDNDHFKAERVDDYDEINEDDELFGKRPLVKRAVSIKARGEKQSGTGEKKVVRFADALGLDLVSIKMIFNQDQPPQIPQSIINCLMKTNKSRDESDLDTKSLSFKPTLTLPNTFIIENNLFQWKYNFTQPGLAPNFYTRLNSNKVLLDSLYNKGKSLHGIVRVINLFYEKHVCVRYTCDNWKSFNDLQATYMLNSSDGLTDRFSFELALDDKLMLNLIENANTLNSQLCFSIQFALSYSTKCPQTPLTELSFWDNNDNSNYSLSCLLVSKDFLNNFSSKTCAFD